MTCSWFTRRSSSSHLRTLWPSGSSWQPCGLEESASCFVVCPLVEHLPAAPLVPISDITIGDGALPSCAAGGVRQVRGWPWWLPVPFWGRGHGEQSSSLQLGEQHRLEPGGSVPSRVVSSPVIMRGAPGSWDSGSGETPCQSMPSRDEAIEDNMARAQRCLHMWLARAVNPETSGACARCGNRAEFHCRPFCSQCGGERRHTH